MSFTITGPHLGQAAVCIPIVRSLPEWFGIEADIVHYAAAIDHLPTFLAGNPAGAGGFLSLKQHNPYAAEVYVMGVRRECQRTGIGRRLLQDAEAWLRSQNVEYLQAKTLGPSDDDENYARTRAFYLAMGFRPLEECMQIWDAQNPCLILIKRL
ncbi:MAG: GNAT family N-acetyltransferase [Chloroflexi bacterium]|nr:GNAT family N-acetyltransferase [Chloroflexota bacterium]